MQQYLRYRIFIKKTAYYIGIFGLIAFVFSGVGVHAFPETDSLLFRNDPNTPWHISADEVEYDQEADQYVAKGNVSITKDDKTLNADIIRFDYKAMNISAKGHVVMTAGEDILTGTGIEMDLNTETGTIYDGAVFLKENHFYIKGSKIQKTDKNTYTADKASISACDGDIPAWKITGKNLKVTIEGYAVVKHAALWAKDIPVMYVPFFVFPVKQKRQSGLLIPETGYSDRKGLEYQQPFYWAVNDSSDATLYFNYMEKRGNKIGSEYRYVLDDQSKGTLMFDFLDDRTFEAGNSDRYWFRMKHDQKMPFGFSAKLDIDVVSDQDYLHDFKDGYTGFEKTEAYFNKTFGRELDDYNDPVRVSSFSLNKIWSDYSLNLGARWYDNAMEENAPGGAFPDNPLHKLPFIRFDSLKQQISDTPFYWQLDSEYTYFYGEEGAKTHRADVWPRFSLPYRFKNYFTAEPSVGLRETIWYVDEAENHPVLFGNSAEKDNFLNRELYDIKLELYTKVFKNYSLRGKNAGQIKHTISPQIVYEYIPHSKQRKYPNIDDSDRIKKKNLITCSITNTVVSKALSVTDEPLPANRNQLITDHCPLFTNYFRFKLEQSYDINEANETDPAEWKNQKEKRPFSPISAEIELVPGRFVSLEADAEWCVYENDFQSRNVSINLWDERGDRLSVAHRYTQDAHESVYADIMVKLSDSISAYADYERNIYDRKELRNCLGILYNAQCWSAELRHTNETDEHKYAFMITLYGLGEIGSIK
ncbi:LPS-assembly protein LptD [Desulfonema magnum]|nr:LPS assembly protein LptD [Desulfonema magnum]